MAVKGLALPMEQIALLCREYGVAELSVFGSAIRNEMTPASDIDFVVRFKDDDLGPWLSKLNRFEEALTKILGRKADVVPRDNLKWVIRDKVLARAEPIYVSEV